MLVARETNIIAIKLDDGENLVSGLEQAFTQNMIKSGIILGGIGMVTNFKLGYYTGKEYVSKEFSEPHELVNLQGSVAQGEGGKLMLHLHCTVGSQEHTTFGGHLMAAQVKNMAEIFAVRLMDTELRRRKSDRTGLMELEFHKVSDTKVPHSTKHKSGSMELDLD